MSPCGHLIDSFLSRAEREGVGLGWTFVETPKKSTVRHQIEREGVGLGWTFVETPKKSTVRHQICEQTTRHTVCVLV